MTIRRKIALVREVHREYGLAPALAVMELAKSTWYYHHTQKVDYEQKYAHVRPDLEEIARQCPEYGYRRTTEELCEEYGYQINHKVVQRLHRMWGLPLMRSTRTPKPSGIRRVVQEAGGRVNLVAQVKSLELFQVSYTDFTEIRYANGTSRAYLMTIIGHVSKMVYGWALGEIANTDLALLAWEDAKRTFQKHKIPYKGMIIHHDQDSVYTSYAWTGQLLLKDELRVSYALLGAKDNPEMESFHSRFKEEGNSLFLDAQSVEELDKVIARRILFYNAKRRHSSIDYMSPLKFIKHRHRRKNKTRDQQ